MIYEILEDKIELFKSKHSSTNTTYSNCHRQSPKGRNILQHITKYKEIYDIDDWLTETKRKILLCPNSAYYAM